MTNQYYPNLTLRAKRLTLLDDGMRMKQAERIARRSIRLAFGMEHGLEGFSVPSDSCSYATIAIDYVNRGDPYNETLVRTADGWIVSCWGDQLEIAEQAYAEQTGEARCGYCGEWTDYVDPDNEYKGLCCGASA